jgi:hypothetical protein
MASMALRVQDLVLVAEGWLDAAAPAGPWVGTSYDGKVVDDEGISTGEAMAWHLAELADDVEMLHMSLTGLGNRPGEAPLSSVPLEPLAPDSFLELNQLVPNLALVMSDGQSSTTEWFTLLEGYSLLLRHARAVASGGPTNATASQPAVRFLLDNLHETLPNAANETAALLMEAAVLAFEAHSSMLVIFIVTSTLLVDFVVIALILPSIRQVETEKERILRVFVEVPRVVVRYLRHVSTVRLRAAVAAMQGLADEDIEYRLTALEDMKYAFEQADVKFSSQRERTRAFTKDVRSFLESIARLALPLLAVSLFLAIIHVWDARVSADLAAFPSGVMRLGTVASLTTSYLGNLRALAVGRGFLPHGKSWHTMYNDKWMMEEAIDATQRVALFGADGDVARHSIVGLLALIPELEELQLDDACPKPKGSAMWQMCAGYESGLVTEGLNSVVEEVLRQGKAVRAALQYRSELDDTHGWPIDSDADARRVVADGLRVITELQRSYLAHALHRTIDVTLARGARLAKLHVSWVSALFFLSVCGIIILYTSVYMPAVSAIDFGVKQNRMLLLLFPAEVVAKVPSVSSTIADMASREQRTQKTGRT